MMMPANYSVVAENEMTYVVGGGIADILAPVMTAQNVQNIVVNTITMVGSFFVDTIVNKGLGLLFTNGVGADYSTVTPGALGLLDWKDGSKWYVNLGNMALNAIGVASAIYTMGVKQVGPGYKTKMESVAL